MAISIANRLRTLGRCPAANYSLLKYRNLDAIELNNNRSTPRPAMSRLHIPLDADYLECRIQLTALLKSKGVSLQRADEIAQKFIGDGRTLRTCNLEDFHSICSPFEARILHEALQNTVS